MDGATNRECDGLTRRPQEQGAVPVSKKVCTLDTCLVGNLGFALGLRLCRVDDYGLTRVARMVPRLKRKKKQ